MKKIIAPLVLLILSACAHKYESQITLPNTEMRIITSKENNVAYKLFVSLPEGYHTKGHHSYMESYPVLYLLDPDVEFGMAENIARTMVNYDTIRPFIIVGIGYQNQDLTTMSSKEFWEQWTKNRARDYIPIQVEPGKEDFLKNLALKKNHPDFQSDMSSLLPIELNWSFEESYQFVVDNVISRLP